MGMDYDLVILGSNQWAEHLAVTANAYGARTAWLLFPDLVSPLFLENLVHGRSIPIAELQEQGIDVIADSGNFMGKQTLQVSHRQITSRHFVLCGREHSLRVNRRIFDCLHWQNLSYPDCLAHCPTVAIGGDDIYACMIAQWLQDGTREVHLFLPRERILPSLDREAGRYLQATLEAQGIIIHSHHRITGVKDGTVWAGSDTFQMTATILPYFVELVDVLNLGLVPPARLHYLQCFADIYTILPKILMGAGVPRSASSLHLVPTHPPLGQWHSDLLLKVKRPWIGRSFVHGFTKVMTDAQGKVIFLSALGGAVDLLLATLPHQYLPRLAALHPLITDLQEQFHRQNPPASWRQFIWNVSKDFNL
jgi:hypothetical protein